MTRRGTKTRKTSEQVSLDIEDGGPDRARLKEHHAYFTPQGATRVLLQTLRDDFGIDPRRIRDPNAGAGVFGWAADQEFPNAHRTGIEVREEEAEHVKHNYDLAVLGDYLSRPVEPRSCDLLVTNPSFKQALLVADKGLRELDDGGWMGLLLRLTWGDHAGVSAWLREHPPVGMIELNGRLELAVGINPASGNEYQEDSVTYRMWLWRQGAGRLTARGAIDFERYLKLDRLADADRSWLRVGGVAVRPGTEYLFGL